MRVAMMSVLTIACAVAFAVPSGWAFTDSHGKLTVLVDAKKDHAKKDRKHREGTEQGTMQETPRNSQPGMSGATEENKRGRSNSGSTEDGGSRDRSHADQNQGGRS